MVEKIRNLRDEIQLIRGENSELLIQGSLPDGQEISPGLDSYVDEMVGIHCEGLVSDAVLQESYELKLPLEVVQLFKETCAPRTGSISLDTSFQKAEILDGDGEVIGFDKHLVKLGRIEENDLVVDANSGEIILSDIHY